jgi:hypothetical protein
MAEKRHYSRVNFPLSAVLRTPKGPVKGEILDIGPGGAPPKLYPPGSPYFPMQNWLKI